MKLLSALEKMVQAIPGMHGESVRQPDLTIWFDLPAPIAASRLALTREPDKFEAQPLDFFARVAAGYLQRMNASGGRFARIDADASREAVWLQVLQTVQGRGWLT